MLEYFPASQSRHTYLDDAPQDIAYLPSSQFMQVLEPLLEEYLPCPQSRQFEGSSLPSVGRYFPTGQSWHVEREDALVDREYFPVGHEIQVPFPLESLYFPAGHDMQGPWSGPVNPRLQSQNELPIRLLEFAGHAKHGSSPYTALNFDASQSEQDPGEPVSPGRH